VSNAAQRRAIAEKIAAKVERLRQEIDDRRKHLAQARARGNASTIAKAEGAIAKTEEVLHAELKRLGPAIDRAEHAEAQERKKAAERAAIRARNIGLMRRLDALREAAPSIRAQWEAERKDEEKRLKKLKKKLEQRTHKDQFTGPKRRGRYWEKPIPLPPPIEQPDLSDTVDAAPPREGLIPGTYKVVDPDRLCLNLLDDEPLPASWTPRHVGKRFIEAHDVLRRLPMNVRPQGYSALWPEYTFEPGELAIQAGAETLAIGRNVVFRTASASEVARMSQALEWIVRYLTRCNAWSLVYLNQWASSRDATPDDKDAPVDLLEFIAAALNEAKEPVK